MTKKHWILILLLGTVCCLLVALPRLRDWNDRRKLIARVTSDDVSYIEAFLSEHEILPVILPRGSSLLHFARSDRMINLLVAKGANVNSQNDDGVSPLHVAATLRSPGMIKALLSNGADVSLTDRNGRTVIHWLSIEMPLFQNWKYLFLDLNAKTVYMDWNGPESAELLLAAGADPNARDSFGRTPIMDALDFSEHDLVKAYRSVDTPKK